ncbi:MAG: glutathione peroxidase [Halioglobus sp.]|nr:glutathione peroxidase [Halioglobus sp.]|tara:strand:- start:1215 stop:1745 length:531 start_codon:yes stop_codon:yes gene_type:complete
MPHQHYIAAVALLAASQATACPDYLDVEMRKLHSQQTVNLCEAAADGPLLIVNTASHCGFTSQFAGLEALNQQYKERGLTVIGFASDDFKQAAKDEETAAQICYVNYGVTFTMLAPSHVRGDEANGVFSELARQAQAPGWNFNKYVVDRQGRVTAHFGSRTRPDDDDLKTAIEEVL